MGCSMFWFYCSILQGYSELLNAILIGLVSTVIYSIFIWVAKKVRLSSRYKPYQGVYMRTAWGEPSQTSITSEDDKEAVFLRYDGGTKFTGLNNYGSARGKADIFLQFNPTNHLTGDGILHYYEGGCKGHLGIYSLQLDLREAKKSKKSIYAYYRNTKPDNTVTGYEVWEKVRNLKRKDRKTLKGLPHSL